MLYCKYPFQITDDDRFGKGSLAISQKLMCSGNETTVWECENDVPSQRSFCSNNVRTKLDEKKWVTKGPEYVKNFIHLSSNLHLIIT